MESRYKSWQSRLLFLLHLHQFNFITSLSPPRSRHSFLQVQPLIVQQTLTGWQFIRPGILFVDIVETRRDWLDDWFGTLALGGTSFPFRTSRWNDCEAQRCVPEIKFFYDDGWELEVFVTSRRDDCTASSGVINGFPQLKKFHQTPNSFIHLHMCSRSIIVNWQARGNLRWSCSFISPAKKNIQWMDGEVRPRARTLKN